MKLTTLSTATALLATGLAVAQSPTAPDFRPGEVAGASLQLLDGELYSFGPNFQAHFADAHFEYLPALGMAAPHDLPIRFSLESVGRSDGAPVFAHELGAPRRTHGDGRVDYLRSWLTESYEVGTEGVEQSFTFRALPNGSGDLVVRGRIDTELQPRETEAGYDFVLDGVGVSIEKVVGIDARGRRIAGTMSFDGEALELVLPSEFVDEAALPLVLDPLFGTNLDTDTTSNDLDDQDPDIAYDATFDRFLVVFERRFSASSIAIIGQLINGNGTLQGVNTGLRISGSGVGNPAVANINFADRFLVVWQAPVGIEGIGVRANPSAVTGSTRLIRNDPPNGLVINPDVGGEATTLDDEGLVVWHNTVNDTIEARQVRVNLDDSLSLNGGLVTIADETEGNNFEPCISKSGGSTGYHMIAWRREVNGRDTVQAAIVDRNLNFIDASTAVTSNQDEHFKPDCDGDGRAWVIAYEREEPTNPTKTDIACRGYVLNNALFGNDNLISHPEFIVVSTINNDDADPCVTFMGSSALVGYQDEGVTPSEYDVRLWSVDPFDDEPCAGQHTLEFGNLRTSRFLQVASKRSGDPTLNDETAVFVWESTLNSNGNSDILARAFVTSDDGDMVDLGGGCGVGGRTYATCSKVGNLDFTHRLYCEEGGVTAWFIMSVNTLDATCGSCTLVPNVFDAYVFATTTDLLGRATVVTPIPAVTALAGVTWVEQWAVDPSASAACGTLGIDFSNALRMTIED